MRVQRISIDNGAIEVVELTPRLRRAIAENAFSPEPTAAEVVERLERGETVETPTYRYKKAQYPALQSTEPVFDFSKLVQEMLGPRDGLKSCASIPYAQVELQTLATAPREVNCGRCTVCGSFVGNEEAGCMTCGWLAVGIMSECSGDVSPVAMAAAQESAEAVVEVTRFLDALECDADDPLSQIRRKTHAPLRTALNKALNKMATQQKVGMK